MCCQPQPLSNGAEQFQVVAGSTRFQRTESFFEGRIMQSATASELGYANAALMLGLLDVLANKGILPAVT
jgi:hypothetical protein